MDYPLKKHCGSTMVWYQMVIYTVRLVDHSIVTFVIFEAMLQKYHASTTVHNIVSPCNMPKNNDNTSETYNTSIKLSSLFLAALVMNLKPGYISV